MRHIRTLERYRYTFLLLGVAALLLPLLPGVGREINGARLWVRIGPLNFQPGEAAKVLLVIFFAAYLVDKRELLRSGTRRFLGMALPDPKHLGPLLLAWGFSILVMVRQKDLGSSLLFFAVFAAMLYIATERGSYLIVAFGLFVAGAVVAYQFFQHVQDRVGAWIDPWSVARTTGFQIVQSMYALGSGGFAGTGLGLGSPQKIPNASTDFVFSAIGEELGLIGTIAVCILFLLFVGSGLRIAVQADRPFSKLFAAGLTTIVGVQTFVIIGGVIRVIPLTGVTLPFISYGGSSLVANFVIVALLLRISDETVARLEQPGAVATAAIGGDGVAVPVRPRPGAGTEDPVNRAIRRVGYALTAVILVLVGQLTYLQVIDASNLANDPNNIRKFLRDVNRPRGEILTADDQIVAQSLPTHGELKYQRVYPQGDLFSAISGYQSFVVGNTGVEASYNSVLTGRDRQFDFSQIISGKDNIGNVILSQTIAAQQTARDALEGQKGSVVALDIRTGEVLAMYSNPSFDPEPARGPRHREGEHVVLPAQRRHREAPVAPRVPRAVSPGVDVQGRDRRRRDHDRQGAAGPHLSHAWRRSHSRARPPGSATSAGRRVVVGRSPRASSNRATRRSRGSATRWAKTSCPS